MGESLGGRVLEMVARFAPDPGADPVRPDTRLETIGFDSLAYAELATALDEELHVDLVDGEARDLGTVADLVRVVERSAVPHRDARRSPEGMGRRQASVKRRIAPILRRWFQIDVEGADRMPPSGPVVLAMNHESLLDIPFAVIASPRPVTFMAKRELFKGPATRVWHALGGFRVDRDAFDLEAIEVALETVERGEVLGMYPEGTRRPGILLPFLPGAAWLALRTGAPLQPAAIVGSERAMPPGRKLPRRVPIRVVFEEPIDVEPVGDPQLRRKRAVELTEQLRGVISGLLAHD